MAGKCKTPVEIVTPCVAILGVTAMEVTALIKGIDGTALAGP